MAMRGDAKRSTGREVVMCGPPGKQQSEQQRHTHSGRIKRLATVQQIASASARALEGARQCPALPPGHMAWCGAPGYVMLASVRIWS